MLLPQTAEYALRAMARLAALAPGEAMTARDLAGDTSIPVAYLSKILRRLVLDGLLLSQKGHHGGFALALAPEDIVVADILAATDFEFEADHCAFGWARCNNEHPCPLHPIWSQLKTALRTWAASTTLADVDLDAFVRGEAPS